jgi:hypothetical protein
VNKSKKMKILFFCLIPVGVIILVFSIRLVKKTFYGKIILEIAFTQKKAGFELKKEGNYSIWHKGQQWRKAPLDEFKPEITRESTGSKIVLSTLLLRPNQNNGKNARMELFRFKAPAGRYMLELKPGSSISAPEDVLISQLPARLIDPDKYFIQVRESQPAFMVLVSITAVVLASIFIIGGLVLGLLADQIFIN